MPKPSLKENVKIFKARTEFNIEAIDGIVCALGRVGLDKVAQELDIQIGTIRHNLKLLDTDKY